MPNKEIILGLLPRDANILRYTLLPEHGDGV